MVLIQVLRVQPGGSQLGHIDVTGAQIGRQQSNRDTTPNGDSYRHAFLIRESRRDVKTKLPEDVDHILCAESDVERDDWVRVLAAWYSGEYVEPPDLTSAAARSTSSTSVDLDRGASIDHRRTAGGGSSAAPTANRKIHTTTADTEFPSQVPGAFGGHRRDVSLGAASVGSYRGDDEGTTTSGRPIPMARAPRGAVDLPPSSSLPNDLEAAGRASLASGPHEINLRSASALGQYADSKPMLGPPNMSAHANRHMTAGDALGLPRPMSPEKRRDESLLRTAKISGPTNAMPISNTATFKAPHPPVSSGKRDDDRRTRVKSSFWGFAGRGNSGTSLMLVRVRHLIDN